MKGERVKFVEKGYEEEGWTGREGTVTDHFCDYGEHRVGVRFDGEDRVRELRDESFEHLEDPYEYAVKRTSTKHIGADFILGDCWETRAEREDAMARQNVICDEWEKQYGSRPSIYSLVRRLKPGKIEEVV